MTTTNSNGKGFTPKPRQPEQTHPTAQEPQTSSASDYMDQAMNQADRAMAGLEQAQKHNAAAAVNRHAQNLKLRVQELQDTFSILNDPDLPVALAEIRSAQEISDRLGKRNYAPRAALPKVQIDIPGVPDFSRFYSQDGESQAPGRSQHQLSASTSSSELSASQIQD